LLVLQQYGPTKAWHEEWQYVLGAATYFAAGLAMIVGSMLKPRQPRMETIGGVS
jgi:hypothetical protein